MRVFIVFRDTIYAGGLKASLADSPGIESVGSASSIALAWEDPALAEADVVLLDGELGGVGAFIQEITIEGRASVLLCLREPTGSRVQEAIANGVCGAVSRDQLTPQTLLAAIAAVASGICAFDTGVLRILAGSVPAEARPSRRDAASERFSTREQMVLSLVAQGLSNREIAERLCYSERTIKTVLHDVVTKLGVKSRSQAVALAVRERMI
jgi:DNA-binding NarL/FixJ family response regulator